MPIPKYISAFETKYKKIEKKGVIFHYKILAFQLVKKANITRKEKALVFAGVCYLQSLPNTIELQWLEH